MVCWMKAISSSTLRVWYRWLRWTLLYPNWKWPMKTIRLFRWIYKWMAASIPFNLNCFKTKCQFLWRTSSSLFTGKQIIKEQICFRDWDYGLMSAGHLVCFLSKWATRRKWTDLHKTSLRTLKNGRSLQMISSTLGNCV